MCGRLPHRLHWLVWLLDEIDEQPVVPLDGLVTRMSLSLLG
jgi:hypothetical protein